jgi:hypothetical protein
VNPKIKYLRKNIEARQIGSYVIIVYDFSSFIILSEEKNELKTVSILLLKKKLKLN